MNIHQLSVSYLHEQDRILVRINSTDAQEIRLWLTRRLCLGWAPVLRATLDTLNMPAAGPDLQHTAAEPPRAWVGEFQRLQQIKDSDFSTPFRSDARSWPLGSEPLLVTTVHMAPGNDCGMEMRFEEVLAATVNHERSFHAKFAAKLLHGFHHLLEQALETSQWEPSETTALGRNGVEIDEHGGFERPQFLH